MKTTGKLFTLLFVLAGLTSCYSSIPLEKKPSENNTTYTVSYLFEHDGCKVYRFYDMGHYVYFTTRGDVTAIKTIRPSTAPSPSAKNHWKYKKQSNLYA